MKYYMGISKKLYDAERRLHDYIEYRTEQGYIHTITPKTALLKGRIRMLHNLNVINLN